MKKSDNSRVNIIDINLFSERCTVPVHKLFYIVFLLCLLIVFTGCEFFNRPMLDFLEEWTNTAQIGKHSLDGSYPETGGMVNLPSGSDRVITYYVANPQSYDLGIEVTFDPNLPGWDPIRTSNHPDFSTTSNQGTVEQDPIDKSIIRLTLNENALASLDGTGSTLSGNGEFPTYGVLNAPNGGAVRVRGGTFTMKGGTINGNKARFGGAVYVDGGFFAMTGGTISTNSAFLGGGVFVRAGSFTMSGTDAKIRGNASSPVQGGGVGEGGGVFVSGGSFNMSDGVISENRAYLGAGAGIYINGGSVSVSGGSIDNNSADTVGGGVCISFGNVEISGSVTIQDNMLLGSEFKGTELYIGAENLTISGGVIQNGVYSMSMGIPSYAIYSEKTFAMTGSPTITDCAITLEQGAHIDVQGLSTDAALTNLQISPTTYTAGEALLEHATDIAICKKFGLYSPPADGIW